MKWHQPAAALLAIAVALGLLVVLVPDVERSAPKGSASAQDTRRSTPPSTTTTIPVEEFPEPLPPVEVPAELVAEPAAPVTSPPPADPHTVMLIGDSIAFTAALGLAPHAGAWGFAVVNEGINGCGVVRGGPYRYFGAQRDMEARCEDWPAAWQSALDRNLPDLVVIVVGRWELMDRVHEGRWTNVFDPAFAAYLESEVELAVALARSGGSRVAVFTTPYYRRGTPPGGGTFPEDDPARVDAVNTLLRSVADRRGVPVIDVGGWLSPDGRYTATVGGIRVRSDGVHLTRRTGDILSPWLFPQLQTVMVNPPPVDPLPPEPPPPPVGARVM